MPNNSLKGFGMWRDRFSVHRRHNQAGVRDLSRVAAVSPDDACDFSPHRFRVLKRSHQIRADILFQVAAANRKYEHAILR